MEYITQLEVDTFSKIKGKSKDATVLADKEIVTTLHQKFTNLARIIEEDLAAVKISKANHIYNPSGTTLVKKYLWYRVYPKKKWADLEVALTFSLEDAFYIRFDSDNWHNDLYKRKQILELRQTKNCEKRIEVNKLLSLGNYQSLKDEILSFYNNKVIELEKELLAIASTKIGLLASDGTNWQDEYIEKIENFKYATLWNSKKPTNSSKGTLKELKETIKRNGHFELLYLQQGQVKYIAEIVDFAIKNSDLDKWEDKKADTFGYNTIMNDYRDESKWAKIVFLCQSLRRLPKEISKAKLKTYDCDYPRQDNLSPFFMENEFELLEKNSSNDKSKKHDSVDNEFPVNQILFGPPGTGKTYTTINKALEICGVDIPEDRKEIKQLFDEKVAEGRIVFTTFHQSMSYEDFVEGIKPQEPKQDGDPISYVVEDGLFKRICEVASRKSPKINREIFAAKYEEFAQKLPPKEEEDSDFVLETPTGYSFWLYQNSAKSISVKAGSKKAPMSLALSELEKVFFENKKPTYKPYTQPVIDEILKGVDIYLPSKAESNKPYVLIIDEINRGNIAEIFGELITLLEQDKRLGNSESLEVMLPYSKTKFGVPKNLYIIGTMNTADRSVEALDTALRRRFNFEEIAPNPDLIRKKGGVIDYIDLADLLMTINNRIEKLMDKDHLIGHSYFLNVKTLSGLMAVFYKNIIPLLQEHFFGDYGKIGLILGEGFVQEKESDSTFARFSSYETQGLEERKVYKIHDYQKGELNKSELNMTFKQAITALLETA